MYEHQLPNWATWSEIAMTIVWLMSAAFVWALMRRRGHDTQLWLLISLIFGPFAIPAAIVSTRRASRRPARIVQLGSPGPGSRDVAIMVDLNAPQEAGSAVATIAPNLRNLAFVAVIGPDTLDRSAHRAELARATAALLEAADLAHDLGINAEAVVVEGRKPDAAHAYAARNRLDLVEPRTRCEVCRTANPL